MEVRAGHKQTEVGVIPEDWDAVDLQAVCSMKSGEGITSATIDDFSEYPCFGGNGLRGYTSRFTHDGTFALIGRQGALCGNVIRAQGKFFASEHAVVVTARPGTDIAFLTYVLGRMHLNRYSESSAQPGLSVSKVLKLALAFPPTEAEQRAIAAALSDVDALLGGLDRLIAKKRDLKQAAMQQLLTDQIRLPGFKGEWKDTRVQDVIAGWFCGPSPTCEERNIQDAFEWGVLKTTAATKDSGWDWTKHKTLPRVYWNKPHIELKKGDVIVTKAGPRHRVGVTAWVNYVPPRIIPSGKMIALRPRPDKVMPLMLAAAISARGAQTYLDQRTTGMAESQVNFENIALLEAPITIPSIEEQTAIAAVLSDMDAELAALESRRDKTHALKQAMMQELLTGRTRLI